MEQQNENESPIRNLMPLDESIMKSKKCVELMVDNRYMDAVELSSQLSDCSLYHSHCHSMLLFFKVYMSLELVCYCYCYFFIFFCVKIFHY